MSANLVATDQPPRRRVALVALAVALCLGAEAPGAAALVATADGTSCGAADCAWLDDLQAVDWSADENMISAGIAMLAGPAEEANPDLVMNIQTEINRGALDAGWRECAESSLVYNVAEIVESNTASQQLSDYFATFVEGLRALRTPYTTVLKSYFELIPEAGGFATILRSAEAATLVYGDLQGCTAPLRTRWWGPNGEPLGSAGVLVPVSTIAVIDGVRYDTYSTAHVNVSWDVAPYPGNDYGATLRATVLHWVTGTESDIEHPNVGYKTYCTTSSGSTRVTYGGFVLDSSRWNRDSATTGQFATCGFRSRSYVKTEVWDFGWNRLLATYYGR